MQKFIMTDEHGNTAEKVQLKEGKTTHSIDRKSGDPMIGVLTSAKDSALLAALTAKDMPAENSRLFMLNTWKVGVDANDPRAYTVVKEVSLPDIAMHHKVAFTLAMISQIYGNAQFVEWARAWVAGEDRTLESAQALRKSMKQELEAAEGLADLAAWGAANDADDGTLDKQRDGEQRAMYAAAAAEFVATPDFDVEEVCSALTRATADIDKFTNRKEMAQLAETVLNCTG